MDVPCLMPMKRFSFEETSFSDVLEIEIIYCLHTKHIIIYDKIEKNEYKTMQTTEQRRMHASLTAHP